MKLFEKHVANVCSIIYNIKYRVSGKINQRKDGEVYDEGRIICTYKGALR